jgi:AhpD family alkylhydroperoxidase
LSRRKALDRPRTGGYDAFSPSRDICPKAHPEEEEGRMETVRIPEEHEFPPEARRVFQGAREWMKIDWVPKMSRVIAWSPEFQWGFGRAVRRTMADGEPKRWQKEILAASVSAMNACEYRLVSHTVAGKLQGATEDALWCEAAYATGIANAPNVVADGARQR